MARSLGPIVGHRLLPESLLEHIQDMLVGCCLNGKQRPSRNSVLNGSEANTWGLLHRFPFLLPSAGGVPALVPKSPPPSGWTISRAAGRLTVLAPLLPPPPEFSKGAPSPGTATLAPPLAACQPLGSATPLAAKPCYHPYWLECHNALGASPIHPTNR